MERGKERPIGSRGQAYYRETTEGGEGRYACSWLLMIMIGSDPHPPVNSIFLCFLRIRLCHNSTKLFAHFDWVLLMIQ